MQILHNTGGVASTNCFVIADEVAKQCVLFDAPDNTTGVLLTEIEKQGWDLIGLWLTHGHFDHIADHAVVTSRFPGAKVLMHRLDEPKILDPHRQLVMFGLPMVIPPRKADGYVDEASELRIGSIKVEVIFTPGHAPGHVSYYLPGENVLVGGDLIIGGAVGRTDLPDSDERQLGESIRKVMKLPEKTTLLPGHGELSTLGEERANNQYVKMFIRG